MNQFVAPFLAIVVCLSGMLAVLIPVLLMAYQRDRTVKLPIDREQLQRLPGLALQRELTDGLLSLCGYMVLGVGVVSLPAALFSMLIFIKAGHIPGFIIAFIVIGLPWCAWKTVKLFKRLTQLRLGHTAELATASELTQLQAKGYQVFHDVPADNFNIDHLAVGPNGVFALETKGRHKRLAATSTTPGHKHYECVFKDNALHFPTFTETKPLKQATRQAKWVSQWLSQAAGIKVTAVPVLVFPGWYIRLQSKPPFPIVSHKQLAATLPRSGNSQLSTEQVNAIGWQIAQRCVQGPEPNK